MNGKIKFNSLLIYQTLCIFIIILFCNVQLNANSHNMKEYIIDNIFVSASVLSNENKYYLLVKIKNSNNSVIEIDERNLPWKNVDNTVVIAVKSNLPNDLITNYKYIDDPWPQSPVVKIKQDETIEGKIDLGNLFPDLSKSLNECDVILFWSYNLDLTKTSGEQKRFGGWTTIKKIEPM